MQKRERSPDHSLDSHLAKQFIRSGKVHISDQPADSSDMQYGSDGALERVISPNGEQETMCTGCECHVPGCNQSFASISDFEDHYMVCHRFVCRYCQRFYATNHLLEIHLTENHDSFFSLLSQQQPMYCCLEESCRHQFMDARSRQDHMTSCHGYPINFHFDRRQHARVVDMTGGPEESRDVDVMDLKKKKIFMADDPSETKVPDTISFGIGGSELFHCPGS